ncbi:TIM-barrel domain-containing protein [Undibacterium sp.]|uniref:glycoside hydrolase family 31 protein n=1 Tax=Undibacterium sp. TaxID=1914977 RepID=UPI0025F04C0B|nr:TIM-barrel domain-containing protein [Undibacterium sp.]
MKIPVKNHAMTKFRAIKLVLLILLTPAALAQNAQRSMQSFADQGDHLEVLTNDGRYLIKPYSEKIIETSFIPNGERFKPESHAVVLAPAKLKTQIKVSAAGIEYATAGMRVSINKSPFQISYAYKGKPLISEKNGYAKKDGAEVLDFNLDASEALYGAGARALGMNRRGHRLPLYNKAHYGYEERSSQMNFSMPLVFSSKMYGIHFDNAPIGFLDFDSKKENVLAYETISGRKTYQVIAGDSWEDIASNYTSLTGRQPLPPRWAFGNFASRFGYHSQAEASAILDKFTAEQIPVDAIIFDLYWFGKEVKGTMGNLAFDTDNFPQPQKMMADFAAKGIKTILITEPFILTTSAKWNEAVQKNILATDKNGQPFTYDFYFGNTGLIDIFKPEAKQWFWNIYKELNNSGVAGWWGDLGEPEVHPSELQHHSGSADQLHNIYGHNWAKLIADGYRKDFPAQRPFILMRSGYSGSQRFGMIPWSGDVNRSWGGLSPQPEIALQMGMQGMAYMHSDLGGFAGANLDDELYTRWLQYGVFQPIFRPHAQEEVAAEPVLREQKTMALAKTAIELRYRLLPYNYTLAFENNQQGLPLMRPLFYEEPHNEKLFAVSDSYLWGHEFLVSPVLKAGAKEAQVYFPVKNNWFDFYTDQQYTGGSTQMVALQADHIPVFVRGGAFIPMSRIIQNTSHYSSQEFDLHYYHDAAITTGQGQLYDDNGETPQAFEKGVYGLLQFSSAVKRQQLLISLSSKNGQHYQDVDRTLSLVLHNIQSKPRQVLLQDKALDFVWDENKKLVSVKLVWRKNTTPVLAISFGK